jgi:hypothetical protein
MGGARMAAGARPRAATLRGAGPRGRGERREV